MGSGENDVSRRRAEYPDHVWSYDFAMDTTEDGRRLKVVMPVVDEYTRECLSLEGERPIKACGVIETLRRLFIERGEPDYIRSDNGPEFIAGAIKEWLAVCGVKTLYIEPSEASSVGERILGDFHQQTTGRVTGEGAIRQSEGGAGTARGLPKALQPPQQATRSTEISDPGGVCGHRSSEGPGPVGAARICTKTLIMTGTENGLRSAREGVC
ncbi:MAG TPA: DDE-type integrase/transposase/recombinase [Rubrobacteraceae bacterium]|nr:DDE-type integrase/transposase/recombinase [Rubrobacteraceae bacterium]